MERGLTVAIAGAAILVAGVFGFSSNKSTNSSGTSSVGATSAVTDGSTHHKTGRTKTSLARSYA